MVREGGWQGRARRVGGVQVPCEGATPSMPRGARHPSRRGPRHEGAARMARAAEAAERRLVVVAVGGGWVGGEGLRVVHHADSLVGRHGASCECCRRLTGDGGGSAGEANGHKNGGLADWWQGAQRHRCTTGTHHTPLGERDGCWCLIETVAILSLLVLSLVKSCFDRRSASIISPSSLPEDGRTTTAPAAASPPVRHHRSPSPPSARHLRRHSRATELDPRPSTLDASRA